MGIRHSLVPLRDYLIKNNYHKKYNIYCGIENLSFSDDYPNVTFINQVKSYFLFFRAAHVFYTAGQIPIKPSKSQIVIHMSHGNADYKTIGSMSKIHNGDEFFFTYMIASSDLYVPIWSKAYRCPLENVKVAGDPLCDQLLLNKNTEYDFKSFDKVIVWLPTFRQSDYLGYNDSAMDTLIPLFDVCDYNALNNILLSLNILLIVKLHPAQSVPPNTKNILSHLRVYSHKEFVEEKYDLYKLISSSDALIGDYSSVSMQYLLLDRPLAYVIPDIEDYKRNRGLVFSNPEDYMGGHIIKNSKEFSVFLNDISNNKDPYKEKRHSVRSLIYKYNDANSCRRIVNLSGMFL